MNIWTPSPTEVPQLQDIVLAYANGYTDTSMMRQIDGCKHLHHV
jgi:hypothetical protein